jgi:hypothetical protein
MKQPQLVQSFMQRITERAVEIAIQKESTGGRNRRHVTTLPKWIERIH